MFNGKFEVEVIGICGFIGTGKSTVAGILERDYGYVRINFSDKLKDAVAIIFGWDRELLSGDTPESRLWRETEDAYWTIALGTKVTPRWVLQYFGTEVMRNNFHEDIWVMSLAKEIKSYKKVVIPDLRFANEEKFLKGIGAQIIRVNRGTQYHGELHASEVYCPLIKEDVIIENNGDFHKLEKSIKDVMEVMYTNAA